MPRLLLVLAAALALAACESPEADVATAPPAETATAEAVPVAATLPADAPTLTVYKTPTCGCCTAWAEYMGREGFRVETRDLPSLAAVKDSLGVPADLGSCHTGVVEGYVVEGHVPAESVRRMLDERPAARGLAVPGMPIGSPGMEQGDLRQPYDVLLVGEGGEAAVYDRVEGNVRP